jgi:hypothetical protein
MGSRPERDRGIAEGREPHRAYAEEFRRLQSNIQTFRAVVAERFNDQPMGDQLWPLLADAYSLKASSVLTLEEAKGFVAALGWEEHTLTSDDKDENQAVPYSACLPTSFAWRARKVRPIARRAS